MRDLLKDRVIQGLIAGMAGWLPQTIFSHTVFSLHLTKFRYADFGAITAFNHKPHSLFEILLAEFLVIVMQGLLGIGFANLLKVICDPNILLKGALYSAILWVGIYTVFSLFRMPHIYGAIDFNTASMHLIASLIWGTTTAWTFSLLSRKYSL